MFMRSALFWDITRRFVVIVYRRFGTTYWSHLHGSRVKMGPIRYPETSVNNYHTIPRNIPEERRSQKLIQFVHKPLSCQWPSSLKTLINEGMDNAEVSSWGLCVWEVETAGRGFWKSVQKVSILEMIISSYESVVIINQTYSQYVTMKITNNFKAVQDII
jgi:hypothetical protein